MNHAQHPITTSVSNRLVGKQGRAIALPALAICHRKGLRLGN